MHRSLAFLCGSIAGGGLIAALDAGLSVAAPVLGSFLPIAWYLGSMFVVGVLATLRPSRRWRLLALAALLIGGAGAATMLTLQPRWDSKIGWRACRLVAGPWHLRSPYPVATPACGILAMCANESAHDVSRLIRAKGCPAP